MARLPAVSADEVAHACDRLMARGQRPSHRLVRLEVGRGSLSTIAEHLHAWQSRQAVSQTSAGPISNSIRALEALSPTAAAALREAFRSEVASELAKARTDAELAHTRAQDLEDALVTSEHERDALADRVHHLEEQFGQITQSI